MRIITTKVLLHVRLEFTGYEQEVLKFKTSKPIDIAPFYMIHLHCIVITASQAVVVQVAPAAVGGCPNCGSTIVPSRIYDINGTGIIIIVLLIILFGPCGICCAVIICVNAGPDSTCHEPRLKCPACGAKR